MHPPAGRLGPGLQERSKSHVESQGSRAHTPLTQVEPSAQTLPQLPQLSLSFVANRQVPLQRMVPGMGQLGVGVVGVVELAFVVLGRVALVLSVEHGVVVVSREEELDDEDVKDNDISVDDRVKLFVDENIKLSVDGNVKLSVDDSGELSVEDSVELTVGETVRVFVEELVKLSVEETAVLSAGEIVELPVDNRVELSVAETVELSVAETVELSVD